MCDYKKIRKWLIIIPFFVLHIFGSPSVISNFFIYNIKDNVSSNITTSDEEDGCKGANRVERKCKSDFESVYTENSCNNFLKNFIDRIKKHSNSSNKEIVVCDNRIDCIDKKFAEFIGTENCCIEEKSRVVFA